MYIIYARKRRTTPYDVLRFVNRKIAHRAVAATVDETGRFQSRIECQQPSFGKIRVRTTKYQNETVVEALVGDNVSTGECWISQDSSRRLKPRGMRDMRPEREKTKTKNDRMWTEIYTKNMTSGLPLSSLWNLKNKIYKRTWCVVD